jgi:hypothetical protein
MSQIFVNCEHFYHDSPQRYITFFNLANFSKKNHHFFYQYYGATHLLSLSITHRIKNPEGMLLW